MEPGTHPVSLDPCHLKLLIQVRANNFSYNAARFPGVVHDWSSV